MKKHTSFVLEEVTLADLDRLAFAERRSRNSMVNELVRSDLLRRLRRGAVTPDDWRRAMDINRGVSESHKAADTAADPARSRPRSKPLRTTGPR